MGRQRGLNSVERTADMAVHSGIENIPAVVAAKSARPQRLIKLLLLVLVVAVVATGVGLIAWLHLGIDHLKALISPMADVADAAPVQAALIFFAANLIVTALSLPIEILFGLAAGALFGVVEGTVLVSFASSLGALLAFLMSRFFMRDFVERHFSGQLEMINRGLKADGSFYVFSVRLVPLFPFSLTNLVLGLTEVPPLKFLVFSQLGMLAPTVIYVNAGTQLASLDSLGDIVSPPMVGTFLALAAFPWAAKAIVRLFHRKA